MQTEKKKIVIADDEEVMQAALTELLFERYDVLTAYNGKEALEMTEKEEPDLVIMDILMPIMDGYEACKHIKAGIKTSSIPVLMLTAKDGIDSALLGFNAGADSYMIKPFTTSVLLAKIKNMIKRAELKKEIN